jgi:hypothetical protein
MSKVLLRTEVLKDLVGRISKVSTSSGTTLDGLVELEVVDNVFHITVIDSLNTLTLGIANVECENFHAVTSTKLFSSLISRITSDKVGITREGNKLIVEGNGNYKLDCIVENDGSEIVFPKTNDFDFNVPSMHINRNEIKSILSQNKACKGKTRDVNQYYYYYADNEKVCTYNTDAACTNPIAFTTDKIFLCPEFVECLPSVSDLNGANIYLNGDTIVATSDWGTLTSVIDNSFPIESMDVDTLTTLFATGSKNNVEINKTQLLTAIDRISLFSVEFGGNNLSIRFNKDGITLKSAKNGSEEFVSFVNSIESEDDFVREMDGNILKTIISSCSSETISLGFDTDKGYINVASDNIKQMICFYEDDEDIIIE